MKRSVLSRVIVGGVLTLAPVVVPQTAQAQDDQALIDMARARFQEGVKHYDAGDFQKARAAFLQAYALKKHPAVLLNLAQSELRSGYHADAATHFSSYLRGDGSAPEKAEAEKGLAKAKAKVAEVKVTAPAGADIYVGGKIIGRAPLAGPVYVKPGASTIEARRGDDKKSAQVTGVAGQSTSVAISFGGAVPDLGSGAGGTSGTGDPGAGGGTGGAGDDDDGDDGSVGFDTDDGASREPFIDWAVRGPVSYIGGGVTVVAATLGVVFAVSSGLNYDDANSVKSEIIARGNDQGISNPCSGPAGGFEVACQTFQDNQDRGDSFKTLATVSFVVGGLALAGTIAYYFIDAKKEPDAAGRKKPDAFRAAVAPSFGPGHGGLSLMGSF